MWGIKQIAVEHAEPLGSGVEAWGDSRRAGQVIFHAFEVHELEYPPGLKFR